MRRIVWKTSRNKEQIMRNVSSGEAKELLPESVLTYQSAREKQQNITYITAESIIAGGQNWKLL